MTLALSLPAYAAEVSTDQEEVAARLQLQGLMPGDEHGNRRLDKVLTRVELARLISPIVLNPEHVAWEKDRYTQVSTANFSNVPEWAQVVVGVCTSVQAMAGYGDGRFGPS